MAVTTLKKTNYIQTVVNQAAAAKAAIDSLAALQLEYANQYATGQTLALVDADFLVSSGTQHLTAAQLSTFFGGYETALASAQSANLQGVLAILPQ